MTKSSLESQALLREGRRAPPAGRALRVLLGLVLIAYVTPVYFRIPARAVMEVLLMMVGLAGVYSAIHIVVARRIIAFSPRLAAVAALGLLVALYVAGASGSPILGRGNGELAAVTFVGISLVIAGVRAVPSCELMAIPSVFFRQDAELACLIFSPLDRLERKLWRKRGV